MTLHLSASSRPLIVVLGPTASGKTAFSLEVARWLGELGRGVEVVNADSRQLYRGFDIGTAKVTPAERGGIPHHLLDVLDAWDAVSIAWYQERAEQAIEGILARGNVPLLVGGSMLYLASILEGLRPLPPADPALRAELASAYDRDAGASLYRELQEADPQTAAMVDRRNRVYVLRAAEVLRSMGRPPSAMKQRTGCRCDALVFGMRWPREVLVRKINVRTRVLFRQGWVAEVERLLAAGIAVDAPGMRSQGYREIAAWIASGKPTDQWDALIEAIAAQARRYAKRQMTWWKRDPHIRWLDLHAEISSA